MSIKLDVLFKGDPIGKRLIQEAQDAFRSTPCDRKLLRRVKATAKIIAEDFLNLYLSKSLDNKTVEEVQQVLKKIRIERKMVNVDPDFAEIYKYLGIIRDYSTRCVELDYPQSLADPLILRACPPSALHTKSEVTAPWEPLLNVIASAQREMDLPPQVLASEIALHYKNLSAPLLLQYMNITAPKVYLLGPVFYGNAGKAWTLTFATGSGLPDPLEWNGAAWFMSEYGLTHDQLERHGLKLDMNPFRAVNFSTGICNKRWMCRRLYVWQRSKTSEQVCKAYEAAKEAGKDKQYLRDALIQLIIVFETPNLKILELEKFPVELTVWTRVSPRNIMLSCRPGSPEEKIGRAVWLTTGLRLSDAAIRAVEHAVAGTVGFGVSRVPDIGPLLVSLANAGVLYLFDRVIIKEEARKYRKTILNLQDSIEKKFEEIWEATYIPGVKIVKQACSYQPPDALKAASETLSSLLQTVPVEEVLAAYRHSRESSREAR